MSKIDAKKSVHGSPSVLCRPPPGEYKFNKTPTEVTYSKLTNSKKPNKGGQHLEKKQRGANILEVKYQKVTYRRYFTKVKYKKVETWR